MPRPRTELGALLHTIANNVYFQAPGAVKMRYPAVLYALDDIQNTHGDNSVYAQMKRYRLTVISHDPDEPLVDQVSQLPTARFDRQYVADNLYHNVFTIYY